jgi:LmbE family N-acetylglucosaminyl deacetylase
MSRRILAIGAHPDDIECGVGATLLKHIACGDQVHILVLTQGEAGTEMREVRRMEAEDAAAFIGASITVASLPDTMVSEKAAIDAIEAVALGIDPDIAYIHTVHDMHQDHRAAAMASRVALRRVGRLHAFQAPSATSEFSPQRFTNVTLTLAGKLELLRYHKSQKHRHYMQEGFMAATACYWGIRAGNCAAAEALEVIVDRDFSPHDF